MTKDAPELRGQRRADRDVTERIRDRLAGWDVDIVHRAMKGSRSEITEDIEQFVPDCRALAFLVACIEHRPQFLETLLAADQSRSQLGESCHREWQLELTKGFPEASQDVSDIVFRSLLRETDA